MAHGGGKGLGNIPLDQVMITDLLSYRISVVANAMSRGAAVQFRSRFDVTLGEWRVLALLGAKQPRALNELARAANLDAGQTSRVITSLSRRGLVLRDEELGAGRPVRLTLTRAGTTLYRQLIGVARQRHATFVAALSEEERRVLDTVLARLETVAKAAAKGEDAA